MSSLIIGGTSGLGLELAKRWVAQGDQVIVTGRHDPKAPNLQYQNLDLAAPELPQRLEKFVAGLPVITTVVYAAGYFQDGRLTDLSEQQIEAMFDVGGRGLIYLLRAILGKQDRLERLIAITSTSGWTPRQREPLYNFVKAGEGHFANAMAEDGRVGKVLVAGPAGMDTAFWRDEPGRDKSAMLDPVWVAEQIDQLCEDNYSYRFAKIMREPPRVEIVETR